MSAARSRIRRARARITAVSPYIVVLLPAAAPRAARAGTSARTLRAWKPRPVRSCGRSAAGSARGRLDKLGHRRPCSRSEVTPVTFDVHQLDTFLLVGARRSRCWRSSPCGSRSRAGLPSLLLYLLMGVALGETGLGIQLRERRARARARLRRAGADPGRGRSDHQLARGPAVDAARALAGHARRRGHRSAIVAVGAHYLLGLSLGARGAARRGHLADRRGRGVLGAARAAAAAAG